MKKLIWFCFFATSPILLNAQTEFRSEIEKLLPPIECKVDVMGVVYPERFQELNKKIQMALTTNKEWFLSYIKQNAKSGEPLPYDERMGMTKDEYAEFLSLGDKREMRKFGSAELTIRTNADTFQFNCRRDLPLDGVKINLRDMSITTPFAVITNPAPDTSEGGGVIGPFSGYQWKFEKDDQTFNNVTTASFLIGQAKKSGRNFIYYKGGIMKSNNAVTNVTVLIFYDQPKP
jgi:hypothetical protein